METSAILTMLLVKGVFIVVPAYFLWKTMTTPPRPEPDSYSDNDEIVERSPGREAD